MDFSEDRISATDELSEFRGLRAVWVRFPPPAPSFQAVPAVHLRKRAAASDGPEGVSVKSEREPAWATS
jgi:hypothetical protein